jgi:hypothetical protein
MSAKGPSPADQAMNSIRGRPTAVIDPKLPLEGAQRQGWLFEA